MFSLTRKIHTRRSGVLRPAALASLIALGLLATTACGGGAPTAVNVPSAPITVTDGGGQQVSVTGPVERVACLTVICEDALVELGMTPVATVDNGPASALADPRFLGPEAAARVPEIGGAFGEENVEDIAVARPQLVVGLEGTHDGLRPAVTAFAPFYAARAGSYQDSLAFLEWMGTVTGRTQQAAAAAQRFTAALDAARAAARPDRSSIALFGTDVNFSVDTQDSVLGSVLGVVGGYPWPNPATPAAGGHSPGQGQYSLEEILRRDPAVLFVQTFSFGPAASEPVSRQLAANPIWSRLSAVRAGRVVEVRTSIWSNGRGTRSLGIVLDEARRAMASAP